MAESTSTLFEQGVRFERRSEDNSIVLPEDENILFSHTAFEMSMSIEEEEEQQQAGEGERNASHCRRIEGELVITTRRLIFLVPELTTTTTTTTTVTPTDDDGGTEEENTSDEAFNLCIDASLIGLFALSNNHHENDESGEEFADGEEEPGEMTSGSDDREEKEEGAAVSEITGQCLYVQCNIPSDHNDEYPVELYLYPASDDDSDDDNGKGDGAVKSTFKDELLQNLFDALSETAELNCPEDDEDDDADCEGFYVQSSDDHVESESTEDARDAMLNKLDSLLIVPPELENGTDVTQGQFDDAEDDDDDDNLL